MRIPFFRTSFLSGALGVFLLFVSAVSANAQQASGLLGKRGVLHYRMGLGYNLTDNYFNEAERDQRWHDFILFSHALSLDYVLDRQSTVGGGWKVFRSGFGQIDQAYSKNILTHSVDFYYKSFFVNQGGALPPLGRYLQTKFSLLINKVGSVENPAFFEDPKWRDEYISVNPEVSLSLGQQQILFGRLILNGSIDFGFVFPSSQDETVGKALESIFRGEIETPYATLLYREFLNFRIGVSWALF
jgi:hypothetical protein